MNPDLLQDIYELSPLQQGMLLHTLLAPEAGVYFEQLCFTITGELDVPSFKRAWARVVARHAALRTCFHWEELERPYQVVCREVEPQWQVEDWREGDMEAQRERLRHWLAQDRVRGFDLAAAPLFRFALFRCAGDSHEFVWSLHHILIDGWSWPLLLKEVFEFYEAEREQRALELPAPRPFHDFISWLHEQDQTAAERFWREALHGFASPTPFRVDTTSAEHKPSSGKFARTSTALSPTVSTAIKTFCRQHQLTVNTLVQVAWAIVLSRYSAESDVVFGSVVSGRPAALEGFESMIGMFINTIPTRVRLVAGESTLALLRCIQSEHMDARQFEHSSLADVQVWSDVPRGTPLFESVLAYENFPRPTGQVLGASGIAISDLRAFPQINYPLTAIVSPGNELLLEMIYDVERFQDATIARMLGHFKTAIEEIASDASRAPFEIPLLTADERLQLDSWNQTAGDFPQEPLHELFEAHVARTPDKEALTFNGQALTYAELNARANRLAHYLRGQGVGPDVVVAVCLERSFEMIVAVLAIMKAGGAYLPLDPTYPKARLAYMLQDSAAPVLVTRERFAADLPVSGDAVLIEKIASELERMPATNPAHVATLDNLIYVIFTSGSTGKPKGAAIEHRGIANLAEAEFRTFGLRNDDRVLQFASLSFDASILEISLAFKAGGTLCMATQEQTLSTTALHDLLRDQRISTFLLPPSLLANISPDDLPALRVPTAGGEASSAELVNTWAKGRRFLNLYGPTEATIWVTSFECQPEGGRPPIGSPTLNTQLYVLDSNLQLLPIGVPGELYIGGAGLGRGYLNHPEITRERFIPNLFQPGSRMYKTGDLVKWRADGNLEYLGRVDHQVKIHGFRVELEEVENCLVQHESVRAAAAVVQEVTGGKKLVAYVVAEEGHEIAPMDLRDYARERLPQYMVPSLIVTLDELPLTPNGKINRNALPVPGATTTDPNTFAPPENEIERKITAIWQEVLGIPNAGRNDNFFDLGGHSLLLTRVHGRLKHELGKEFPIVDLLAYPTVRSLAAHLSDSQPASVEQTVPQARRVDHEPVAVIGMAGAFPGAASVDELWKNLRDGVESIRFFSPEEVVAAGADPELVADPNYVRAGAVLEGADMFDARFFGMTPREAELTDPQHRVFLECAHSALEAAGYDPKTYAGNVGVFAGASMSSYLLHNLSSNPAAIGAIGSYQAIISNDKDFVPSRVSYKLNLTGPSVNVQTACSTSLVAVHMACQSLLNGECDIALAGGVSINAQQGSGYMYQPEGIASPDGHCRSFDAQAQGTVPGNGAAVVVLKRLSRAVEDGDHIEAVILGSAINNDGSQKVGFTAPSVEGQARVIRAAHSAAGVTPHSISYIETHGTGTILGDPIEVTALKRAFGNGATSTPHCALGSIKSNMGHLDAAAGVTGLIKAVLALKNQQLPPSLHFAEPNPKLAIEGSPFFVNAELRDWTTTGPRRAGVSSFGIGGTNAHVVLEEAPIEAGRAQTATTQVLTVSAATPTALAKSCEQLAAFLEDAPESSIADVAYTLHVGRTAHAHRRALLCDSSADAIKALRQNSSKNLWTGSEARREVAFMFPGQGAQFPNMAKEVYAGQPAFRAVVDECAEILREELGSDIRELLFPPAGDEERAAERLQQTAFTQPALFAIEYALARLWMSWGIRPTAMIGHSIGEYVAACLAEVFTLRDVLKLVAARGRMLQALSTGAMLSVALSEHELAQYLPPGVAIAAVNGPALTVASGAADAIDRLAGTLEARGVQSRRLRTSHAFHSAMMDAALQPFEQLARAVKKGAPKLPFISNVTGTWCTAEQATDERYWSAHLRNTVRFADGIGELLRDPDRLLLEVGPGQTLSSLARQHAGKNPQHLIVASLMPGAADSSLGQMLSAVARLWTAGVPVDWPAFHHAESPRRLALPTYPFERERYWIPAIRDGHARTQTQKLQKKRDIANWFYTKSWNQDTPFELLSAKSVDERASTWLIFADANGIGDALKRSLTDARSKVITVRNGDSYRATADSFVIRADEPEDYRRMIGSLPTDTNTPATIVHLWSADGACQPALSHERFDSAQRVGFYSLLHLAEALRQHNWKADINVVTSGTQKVWGNESLAPEKATSLAATLVIKQENPALECRVIDIEPEGDLTATAEQLTAEVLLEKRSRLVAHRGGKRWRMVHENVPLTRKEASLLRAGGVYLITGGLGNIGLAIAEWLVTTRNAKVAVVSRTPLPERGEWADWLGSHPPQDATSKRIEKLKQIEAAGCELLVLSKDVGDAEQLKVAIDTTASHFGALHGIFHAAGAVSEAAFAEMAKLGRDVCEMQFRPKVHGLIELERAIAPHRPDFCVLFSSLSTVLGGLGYYAYAAANLFMDAFAESQSETGPTKWISIDWDAWRFDVENEPAAGTLASLALTAAEGMDVLDRVLSQRSAPHVIVSTADLQTRIARGLEFNADSVAAPLEAAHARPSLATAYEGPRNELDQSILAIWQKLLGIQDLGIHDNFFDLGGHSLLMTQMRSELQHLMQYEVAMTDLFRYPTVASLAEFLSNCDSKTDSLKHVPQRAGLRRDSMRRQQQLRSAANTVAD